jgi:glycosyltransferase involved in cell wall biosynthesis
VPSGIDTFVRGILNFAPDDLDYTLFGATSDPHARPVGVEAEVVLGRRAIRYLPVVRMDPTAARGRVPLIVRYMWSLSRLVRAGALRAFDILDFHRVEPVLLFRRDRRPANLLLHQDMSVLRSGDSDIMWRHAPWLYEAIERRLFDRLDRIYAVRQTAVERYIGLYPQFQRKFVFLPTWVDNTIFRPEDPVSRADLKAQILVELGVSDDRTLLIFVGRLDHQKDPLLLLTAFGESLAKLPGIHLVIVGDGDMRSTVVAAIADANLSGRVSLLGVKGPAEIARLLRGCDLFLLSSAYEGMPIAVLEALASGLPVVSTDVGEIRLVVRSGDNGMISVGRTAPDLAAAIVNAVGLLGSLRGKPCVRSIQPYLPQKILGVMYDNHRQQARERQALQRTS